jgi:hypothetical protein
LDFFYLSRDRQRHVHTATNTPYLNHPLGIGYVALVSVIFKK